MKNHIKQILAVVLVVVLALAFTGCGKLTEEVVVKCTCPGCVAAENAKEQAEKDANSQYSTLKANSKSGVDCSKMPEDKAGILKLYNDVSTATKAVQTQKFTVKDTGAQTTFKDAKLGNSGKPLSDTLMGTVKNLVKQFSPAESTYEYNFQNGTDSNGNKDGDGKVKTLLTALPLNGKKVMSELTADDISDATIEKLEDGYWKISVKVNSCKVEFKDPNVNPPTPQEKFVGVMKSSDLLKSFGPAKITYASIEYKESLLTAVIDPNSGYLVQIITDMAYPITVKGSISVAGAVEGSVDVTSTITYNWTEIG